MSIPVQLTDAEGRLTLDPAMPSAMDIVLWDADVTQENANNLSSAGMYERSELLGPVQVSFDRRESRIELRARR